VTDARSGVSIVYGRLQPSLELAAAANADAAAAAAAAAAAFTHYSFRFLDALLRLNSLSELHKPHEPLDSSEPSALQNTQTTNE
jgi:hypothetical protein